MTQTTADASKPSESAREKLRKIIAERSFSQGKETKLASGKTSTFYFDMKATMLDAVGIDLLAELVLEEIKDMPARYVGGLVMGAVPVAVATVMKSVGSERPLQGFWIRKEVKDHGTQRRADGYLPDGSDVVIVEDVTTSGGSVLQAINEVRARGCRINAVITIVDRNEGAKERLAQDGIKLISLFDTSDFSVDQDG